MSAAEPIVQERPRNPPLRRPERYALTVASVVAKGRAAHDAGEPRTAVPYGDRTPDLRRHWFAGWDAGALAQLAQLAPPRPKRGRPRKVRP